jgi:2'-hydroxyisoflavone reductase
VHQLKILIIGGTRFLGRHLVEAARERGHELTLFNRGQSNPGLFDDIETFRGNRDGGLDVLSNGRWDAVIDTCGYYPRILKQSAEFFRDRAGHYTFVSSISVYQDLSRPGFDESAPVRHIDDTSLEEITGETYGPYKAICEVEIQKAFSDRALVIRPGLIVGPHDLSDRFTYWVTRCARGGDILLPKPENRVFQCIDVRDLAAWMITMVENGCGGVFNAAGPDYDLTMKKFIGVCKTITGSRAELYWIDEQFLLDHEVEPWSELPIWIADKESLGMLRAGVSKAVKAGLKFRNLIETVRDTYEWAVTRPEDYKPRAGLDPAKEKQVLAAWFNRGDIKA